MIQFEKNPTVQTNDTSLPVLVMSDDAQAFATFPDFQSVIHPGYVFESGLAALDRATGALCDNLIGTQLVTATFPNGAPAFDIKATAETTSTTTGRALSAEPVRFAELSYVVALNIAHGGAAAAGALSLLGRASGPRALVSTSNRFSFLDDSGNFVSDPGIVPDGGTVVYVFTYSDGNGGKLFRDGSLVASNAANMVRSVESLRLDTMYGSTYLATATAALQSGHYVTGIDLSKAEHAPKLAAITQYMLETYASI